jgi:hypothetical protein
MTAEIPGVEEHGIQFAISSKVEEIGREMKETKDEVAILESEFAALEKSAGKTKNAAGKGMTTGLVRTEVEPDFNLLKCDGRCFEDELNMLNSVSNVCEDLAENANGLNGDVHCLKCELRKLESVIN